MDKNESAYLPMTVISYGSEGNDELLVDAYPSLSKGFAYYIRKELDNNLYCLIEESTDQHAIANISLQIHHQHDYSDVIVIMDKKEICSFLKKNVH